MRRDTIFYQIFQQIPTLLFTLVAEPPQEASQYTFDAIEVKETGFRMDGVFMPPNPDGVVYFCEVQFQEDKVLYERMDAEIGIFVYRNRERLSDWAAVVIYPTRSVEQSRKKTVQEMLDSGRIQRVYLDELGKIETLPTGSGLMVLTILEDEEAKSEARGLIQRSAGNKDTIDLVSKIMVNKFSTLSRDEVDVMLDIKLQETRVYQEAVAEGEARGRAEGEGGLVLRLLNRRVGSLSLELSSQVQQLTVPQLEDLGEALLDFTGLADLEGWLGQNRS